MKVHPIIFTVSATVVLLFLIAGGLFSETLGQALGFAQDWIIEHFGWYYVAAVAGFFVFVIWLFLSPYGNVKLGKDEDEPEFSYWAWFAMLFSAGMGIGLLFFSVAEPMLHFASPPRGVEGGTTEAARQAMTITFFHWGLHAWAIYIIVAAALAFFSFRHGLPLALRSALYPLIGRHVRGPIGHVVDIIAVFGTVFGLATSLGFGIMQINAGLSHIGFIDESVRNQVILIAVITLAATISAGLGLDRGIRRLSELNLGLAGALLLFVLLTGPTLFLLSWFVQSVGSYLTNLVSLTFRTDALIGLEWQKGWTMFYWAWWISWSPFVGMFIARISRGRTLREFIAGVLAVPTTLTFFWLTVFGGSALHMEIFQGVPLAQATQDNVATAIFTMLDQLPIAMISATLAVIVVTIFFVTSADSGALVIDAITSGDHPERPAFQRVGWSVAVGGVAAVLLVTEGLAALQTAAIITALPFSILMIFICIGLTRGLRAEVRTHDPFSRLMKRIKRVTGINPVSGAPVEPGAPASAMPASPPRAQVRPPAAPRPGDYSGMPRFSGNFAENLDALMRRVADARRSEPSVERAERAVNRFVRDTVLPAFEEIRERLKPYGREVVIEHTDQDASLVVMYGDQEEFAYGIYGHVYQPLEFAFPNIKGGTSRRPPVEKAEVVLRTGGSREYEIREWSRDGILNDFLDAYATWMGW